MTGTEGQVQWAERIRPAVQAEFDRVARALRQVWERQQGQDRHDTVAIIALLDELRSTTLANEHAGYFVRVWQEPSDQVRRLLAQDARYQAIRIQRNTRKKNKSTTCLSNN